MLGVEAGDWRAKWMSGGRARVEICGRCSRQNAQARVNAVLRKSQRIFLTSSLLELICVSANEKSVIVSNRNLTMQIDSLLRSKLN